MLESIIAEIDVEISRLQQARALLVNIEPKRGRPAGTVSLKPAKQARQKRRVMSPETREKMRHGQLKRWAVAKKSTPPKVSR